MSKKISIAVIILIWLVSILFSSPFIYYTTYHIDVSNNVSYCYNDRTSMFLNMYSSTFISVFVFIPSVILSIVYVALIRRIKQINKCQILNLKENNYYNCYKMKRLSNDSFNSVSTSNFLPIKFLLKNKETCTKDFYFKISSIRSSNDTRKKSLYSNNLVTKRKQTITICLVSLAFFFCQIPIKIFQIFNVFYDL